tara:strand:- start:10400 stop:10663 length:264 start_codon:yes stop_codon:yes gene_type:complete
LGALLYGVPLAKHPTIMIGRPEIQLVCVPGHLISHTDFVLKTFNGDPLQASNHDVSLDSSSKVLEGCYTSRRQYTRDFAMVARFTPR